MYPSALSAFERDGRFPSTKSGRNRLADIRAVLEQAGIEFTNLGVKLREQGPATRHQVRKARELLNWSRDRLASVSGVPVSAVTSFEVGGRPMKPGREDAICAALAQAGVDFTNGDAPGVRLRKDKP